MNASATVTALLMAVLLIGNSSCAQKRSSSTSSTAKDARQGWIGVSVADVTPRLAREENLKATSGVLIRSVAEESPAEKAGLKEDDIIVEFKGKKIELSDDLVDAVRATAPETKAAVTVVRGGQKKTLQVIVGKEPKERLAYAYALPHIPHVPTPPQVHSLQMFTTDDMLGLRLQRLNSQLAEYFEIPDKRGVLVENVEKESASEKAGFKAGDVIVKVGNEAVESPEDIGEALEDTKKGDKIEFGIVRKGAQKTITVEAEDSSVGQFYHFRSPGNSQHWHFRGFDSKEFQQEMKKLKEELRSAGEHIRAEMRHLRETVRGALI